MNYTIGVAKPVSVLVNTFGTGIVSDKEVQVLVDKVFNFKPGSIRKELNLDNVKF